MKTAIQQSIEKIKYFQDSTENFAEKRAFAIAMDVLEDHKKTENEQIIDAYKEGHFHLDFDTYNPEKYFNKTFKSE